MPFISFFFFFLHLSLAGRETASKQSMSVSVLGGYSSNGIICERWNGNQFCIRASVIIFVFSLVLKSNV